MGKALFKVLFAVTVAIVGAEVIKKKCPELPRKVADKTLGILNAAQNKVKGVSLAAKDAFKAGYTSSTTISKT
jgi:hypothetical protein